MSRKDNKNRVLNKGETQRADGSYMYRFTVNGKRKTIYANTLNELRGKEQSVFVKVQQGLLDSNYTLSDMFNIYIETKKGLTTYKIYNDFYNSKLKDTDLFNMNLVDIRNYNVVYFYSCFVEKYKYSRMKIIDTIVNNCFEIAIDNDLIAKNPAKKVLKKFAFEKTKPKEALTIEETDRFFKIIKTNTNIYEAFRFMYLTGLRACEMAALTWQDINFERKYVDINKHIYGQKKEIKSGAKTEAGVRKVPLCDEAMVLLKSIKARRYFETQNVEFFGYTGFIFLSKNNCLYSAWSLDSAVRSVINTHNKYQHDNFQIVSCHIMRHTFCTRLAEKGISPNVLMKIMGHSDYKMTQSVYITTQEQFVFDEFSKIKWG